MARCWGYTRCSARTAVAWQSQLGRVEGLEPGGEPVVDGVDRLDGLLERVDPHDTDDGREVLGEVELAAGHDPGADTRGPQAVTEVAGLEDPVLTDPQGGQAAVGQQHRLEHQHDEPQAEQEGRAGMHHGEPPQRRQQERQPRIKQRALERERAVEAPPLPQQARQAEAQQQGQGRTAAGAGGHAQCVRRRQGIGKQALEHAARDRQARADQDRQQQPRQAHGPKDLDILAAGRCAKAEL